MRVWRGCVALLVLLLMVGGGVLAQDATPAVEPLDPPVTVRVAFVPIMKFGALYVAEERGLFDAYGLDVDIQQVASGTEAFAFLEQGQVDVGAVAIVASTWNGWAQGVDVRVIAPGALEPLENSPTKFIVRADLFESGAVTTPADLAGRVVAVAGGPGSNGEYLASKALALGGLTIRDVQLVNLANPDMPAAFAGGTVDAALAGSPFGDQIIQTGDAVAVAEDLTPGLMTVAYVASGGFLDANPEAAQRFVLALAEATRLMQGDDFLSEENVAAYLRYVNTTPQALTGDAQLIFDPNVNIPLAGLADIELVHRENGRTDYDEPIDLSTVIDETLVRFARETLGVVETDFVLPGLGDDDALEAEATAEATAAS